jgi:hypothetical protein
VNVHACARSKLELARDAYCSNGFSFDLGDDRSGDREKLLDDWEEIE